MFHVLREVILAFLQLAMSSSISRHSRIDGVEDRICTTQCVLAQCRIYIAGSAQLYVLSPYGIRPTLARGARPRLSLAVPIPYYVSPLDGGAEFYIHVLTPSLDFYGHVRRV